MSERSTTLWSIIKKKRNEWDMYVCMRHGESLGLTIEGSVEGKNEGLGRLVMLAQKITQQWCL